jgi:predicted DsbA family dithiol-disulfide isomerase
MTTIAEPLRVDIWSDVICPWCAIGKANLDRALERFDGADRVEIVWHSFELDPNAPAALAGDHAEQLARKYGMPVEQARKSIDRHAVLAGDHAEQLARKYGMPVEQARKSIDRVVTTARGVGLDFRYDRIRPGNTFDAHRVIHLAAERGLQTQVKERMFHGYFTEGAAIGLPEEVERLAVDAGLDAEEVAEVLESDAYAAEVRADEADAHQLGATGVPFFVFDGRYAVGGAQPPDVLLEVLQRCWRERTPGVEVLAVADDVCGPDGCEI